MFRYDNNTTITFGNNNEINVKVIIGSDTFENSGTYSVRKEVLYVQYNNGSEAKIPYFEDNTGKITLFPIMGMDEHITISTT